MTGWIAKVLYPQLEESMKCKHGIAEGTCEVCAVGESIERLGNTINELKEANELVRDHYEEVVRRQQIEISLLRNRLIANLQALNDMLLLIEQHGRQGMLAHATRIMQARKEAQNVPGSQDYMD